MTFTAEERRLLLLYYSDSVADTAAIVQEALADITDPDERAVARSLLRKLGKMNAAEFESFNPDCKVPA